MVTTTGDPKLIRVQFGRATNEVTKAQVVCYLKVRDTGIRIYYSHHLIFSRLLPKGAWDRPQTVKMDLTPVLRAEIFSGVYQELFTVLNEDEAMVSEFPGDPMDQPEEVDLGD